MADRVQIIAVDNIVAVNGKPKKVDCSALVAERIHAVQWNGTTGWIEFVNQVFDPTEPAKSARDFKGNERIGNLPDRFQALVEAWREVPDPEPPPKLEAPNPFEMIDAANARIDALEKKIDEFLARR